MFLLWVLLSLVMVGILAMSLFLSARTMAEPGMMSVPLGQETWKQLPVQSRVGNQTWLLYNIALGLPLYVRMGNEERLPHLIEYFRQKNPDVIVLFEAFHGGNRKELLTRLKRLGWKYWEGGSEARAVHNGLYIGSKTPIRFIDSICFHSATSSDMLSSKGAMLFQVNGQLVAVSHLQSWEDAIHAEVRRNQMRELMTWLEPYPEVLIAADFNVDPQDAEVRHWHSEWSFEAFPQRGNLKDYSPVSQLNGIDGTAQDYHCDTEFFENLCWTQATPGKCAYGTTFRRDDNFCPCCPSRQLTWMLRKGKTPLPANWYLETEHAQAKKDMTFPVWRAAWARETIVTTKDLSDHLPVMVYMP